MMLEELSSLLAYANFAEVAKSDCFQMIERENCLGKRSGKTRILTYRHLVVLYSLDRTQVLYRALLYFWNRDIAGQPLLALLCTFARDTVFRTAAPFIQKFPAGATVLRESLEEFMEDREPGRFRNRVFADPFISLGVFPPEGFELPCSSQLTAFCGEQICTNLSLWIQIWGRISDP